MTIAVLALQGAFAEHEKMIRSLGADCIELRQAKDLKKHYDGLILPGGESTVQGKLLKELGMFDKLKASIDSGIPVFATCAGLILLCDKSSGEDGYAFRTIPANVRRNAYGRQLGSFEAKAEFKGLGEVPMTFIRAPYIESVGAKAETLSVVDGKIVAARQDKQLVTAFHPELTDSTAVHKYFLDMIG